MMKRLLKLKEEEDYTLDLNESDESNTEPVEVVKQTDLADWIQHWNTSLQSFTKNLFIQTLQQWLSYKKDSSLQQSTIDSIKVLAKEYGLEDKVIELLQNTTVQTSTEKNTQSQQLQESETSNTAQPTEGQTVVNQPENVQDNQQQEKVSDEAAMNEVLKNLPTIVQSSLPQLVGNIEGVDTENIPTTAEQKSITDIDALKTYLSNMSGEKELQQAFSVFEERINALEPKPVDTDKMNAVKNKFKLKDSYLDDIEKSWQKYMQAVNNNSDTSMLVELKNLLNTVHDFNASSKPSTDNNTTPEPERTEEGQEQ